MPLFWWWLMPWQDCNQRLKAYAELILLFLSYDSSNSGMIFWEELLSDSKVKDVIPTFLRLVYGLRSRWRHLLECLSNSSSTNCCRPNVKIKSKLAVQSPNMEASEAESCLRPCSGNVGENRGKHSCPVSSSQAHKRGLRMSNSRAYFISSLKNGRSWYKLFVHGFQ